MNFGGFSWRRLVGISAFKSRVSRKIGIPLTASGRRRKLGAFVFNAVGPVAGTLAVAAVAATKQQQKSNVTATPSKTRLPKGVYFCEVKGVTHNNDDGTNRRAAQQLCSIGDPVKLVPEPYNRYDRNAIRVLLQTGQQIGYISARQGVRFAGKLHLLTATVHSRVKDEWGNDTLKLRVVNSTEQKAYEARSSTAKGQSPSMSTILAIQAEAEETAKKEGWQFAYSYFENAQRVQYSVIPSSTENTEHIRQRLQDGFIYVGSIGWSEEVQSDCHPLHQYRFGFALNDSVPMGGVVAKRFMANAREWVVTVCKDSCVEHGVDPPVVHELELSKKFVGAQLQGAVLHTVGLVIGWTLVAALVIWVLKIVLPLLGAILWLLGASFILRLAGVKRR